MKQLINVKSIVWRTASILLGAVLFTSYFSSGLFAKYTTSGTGSDSARVARFSYYANINDVSALSFTNTAFWQQGSEVAMNALRSVDFNVRNYTEEVKQVGDKTEIEPIISEVPIKYKLEFVAPQNFVEKLAIQLFNGEKTPILPQIVLSELLETTGNSYTTSSENGYNAEPATQRTFSVTKNDDTWTAVSEATETLEAVTIKIESIVRQDVEQTLYFRLWDIEGMGYEKGNVLKEEAGGKLLAPLIVKFKTDLPCYKISIDMPSFIFPLGEAQTHEYGIRLVPTDTLEDDHLGGTLLDSSEENIPQTFLESVYAGQSLIIRTEEGEEQSSSSPFTPTSVTGKNKETGAVIEYTNSNPFELFNETTNEQLYYVSECYTKNYPMNVKVLFEQID